LEWGKKGFWGGCDGKAERENGKARIDHLSPGATWAHSKKRCPALDWDEGLTPRDIGTPNSGEERPFLQKIFRPRRRTVPTGRRSKGRRGPGRAVKERDLTIGSNRSDPSSRGPGQDLGCVGEHPAGVLHKKISGSAV